MSSLNRVILIGRLGRDPEVRYLENGAAVAKFSIATSESYKDKKGEWQEQTEWHDIVVWRMLAERAEKQLKKGLLVLVEGKLTHRKWEDKEGNKRKTTEVLGNSFRLLEKRDSNMAENLAGSPYSEQQPANKENAEKKEPVAETQTKDKTKENDDLPF